LPNGEAVSRKRGAGSPRLSCFEPHRGGRIVELFKQPAFSPISIELQAVTIYALQKGFYDGLDIKKVTAASVAIREFFANRKDALLTEIRTKAALDKDLEAKIVAALDEWNSTYTA
jgi:F-type H+-transporting ATPase subunit alpha